MAGRFGRGSEPEWRLRLFPLVVAIVYHAAISRAIEMAAHDRVADSQSVNDSADVRDVQVLQIRFHGANVREAVTDTNYFDTDAATITMDAGQVRFSSSIRRSERTWKMTYYIPREEPDAQSIDEYLHFVTQAGMTANK